jgi:CheY-like chemotaxis protein/DNA-binding CsgD family transcriptional regulator
VLVVDDEPDLRELVRINLSLDGHRVLLAADGDEALRVVHERPPDLIVLDVLMPRRDGWAVLGALKAEDPARSQIPVLMLTAMADELDQVRGGIEGAIRYMTKPFSVGDLREAVAQALQGDPEPVKRRFIQRQALTRLARLEGSGPSGPGAEPAGPRAARPHLTRLETAPSPRYVAAQPRPLVPAFPANLSTKQYELLDVVGGTPTVREAAERLGVSRSYVYASLRRIARKLGVRSGPELVGLARRGAFPAGR